MERLAVTFLTVWEHIHFHARPFLVACRGSENGILSDVMTDLPT